MRNVSLRSKSLKVEGRSINYLIGGEGICILFLHGYMESKEVWLDFIEPFLSKYMVIIPDLPGVGQSSCNADINSMENMAYSVKLLLTHNSIDNAIFIGHSMGGYVSLALLSKYKVFVKGIVLLNSLSIADDAKKLSDRLKEISIIKKGKKGLLIKFAIPNSFLRSNRDLYSNHINSQIEIAQKISSINLIATIHGLNIREDQSVLLSKSNIPYIIVHGKNDTVLPAHPIKIEKQIHQNNFLWVDNCGHNCFIEQKLRVQKIVSEFVCKFSD